MTFSSQHVLYFLTWHVTHDLIGPQIAQLERQKQEADAKVDEVNFHFLLMS